MRDLTGVWWEVLAILGTLLARDPDGGTFDRGGRLQMYGPHGALVYDEVFNADAIANVGPAEELWIGDASRMWRYRWRDDSAPPS